MPKQKVTANPLEIRHRIESRLATLTRVPRPAPLSTDPRSHSQTRIRNTLAMQARQEQKNALELSKLTGMVYPACLFYFFVKGWVQPPKNIEPLERTPSSTACWEWSDDGGWFNGFPAIHLPERYDRIVHAVRLGWELDNGPLPHAHHLRPLSDCRLGHLCVNPLHWEPVLRRPGPKVRIQDLPHNVTFHKVRDAGIQLIVVGRLPGPGFIPHRLSPESCRLSNLPPGSFITTPTESDEDPSPDLLPSHYRANTGTFVRFDTLDVKNFHPFVYRKLEGAERPTNRTLFLKYRVCTCLSIPTPVDESALTAAAAVARERKLPFLYFRPSGWILENPPPADPVDAVDPAI